LKFVAVIFVSNNITLDYLCLCVWQITAKGHIPKSCGTGG